LTPFAVAHAFRDGSLAPQPLDFFVEGLHVLEMTIDRREADVRHFIELPQLLHDELTDHARWHFTIANNSYLVSNTTQSLINGLTRNGPLLQGLLHPGAQLRLVVSLANIVRLDDHRHDQFSRLKRSESFATGQTFTPTAYLPPLTRQT
jgi:hypothetical protein